MVDRKARGELPVALAAGADVLIRDPVGRSSCVFYKTWTETGGRLNQQDQKLYSSKY